ncbi:hypothetical protein CANTEDRAFT_125662 [Yamadazyma tenuis ATCC 10573]|uniref:Glycosyl transferase n=1 Tax=Candida tenuis (strain ATCC 10573 / BCRC 21748 / CBS 615 / JCM 9827 / NBRC 10315 / NRRL Y-1498 / VKM Y-70) TaxID=590646 RepID=G3BB09_CANTC|nr:uncharacterized protein CANTEDRAFT_125662 [Yamadazyma tenuis ATCC 10573]EGV62117.1 hypothetical protein CANTEDRAFT_125662 [Yamadazyma tenuis ATCC 10573]
MKFVFLSILIAVTSTYYYYVYTTLTGNGGTREALRHLSGLSGQDLTNIDILKKRAPKLSSNSYLSFPMGGRNRDQIGGENATIVMLVRNEELEGALSSMRSLEDRFNKDYQYPWVFLNDVPFTQEFKEQTTLMASGKTYYELIPEEDWEPPSFIDTIKLEENLKKSNKDVIYGGSRSYRNMCHFNSGFFFKQKRLLNYDWYFRVEPDVEYLCDFQHDPFKFLRENNKVYGFVTTIHEYENTIPTLWPTVEKFIEAYPDLIHPNNSLEFITSREVDLNYHVPMVNSSSEYNLCHFWSNFEIGSLNFWRSEAYSKFFEFLDQSGGFYYERWGDAPVHSIGLNLLADKNSIHHFDDIGYYHPPYMACPTSKDLISQKRCICKTSGHDGEVLTTPYDVQVFSCLSRWWRYGSGKKFLNEVDYIL